MQSLGGGAVHVPYGVALHMGRQVPISRSGYCISACGLSCSVYAWTLRAVGRRCIIPMEPDSHCRVCRGVAQYPTTHTSHTHSPIQQH